jgi:DNA-binding PadR family transcriptional regulator
MTAITPIPTTAPTAASTACYALSLRPGVSPRLAISPALGSGLGYRARTGRLEMPSYVHAHLDFLLLAMIGQEPRDAHSVRRELREQFGARSTPSPQLVYSMLHYLQRNRLIRPLPADPRRYLLTVSGHRSLETRTREWESFAKGTEALLERART